MPRKTDPKNDSYKSAYTRQNYDTIGLYVPKGTRDKIKSRAAAVGKSINQYINDLIRADMDTASRAARNDGRLDAPSDDAPPAED